MKKKNKPRIHNIMNIKADVWPCDLVKGTKLMYVAVSSGYGIELIIPKK